LDQKSAKYFLRKIHFLRNKYFFQIFKFTGFL
jgi:hypothetical protein